MDNATTIALSRLVAQTRALDVLANNVANMNTPGYHAERTIFADWLWREHGNEPPGGGVIAYTQDRATYRDHQPGEIDHTGNPLDLALAGAGYFTVLTKQGPRLTRAGHFSIGGTGTLVDEQGNPLLDVAGKPLQVTTADTQISVAADGTLSSENGLIGKIGVVRAADPNKLTAEGGWLLNATATTTAPLADPKIVEGAVENSDVQPTLEITRMMDALRSFQMVVQFIQAEADRHQGAIERIMQQHS
jgi:flagellar basal-body rod protein FlgF